MSSCSHSRTLEFTVASLMRRVDGLEAAIGELRAKLSMLERVVGADADVGDREPECGDADRWDDPVARRS